MPQFWCSSLCNCTASSLEGSKDNDYDCISAVVLFVLLHCCTYCTCTTWCTLLVGRTRTVISRSPVSWHISHQPWDQHWLPCCNTFTNTFASILVDLAPLQQKKYFLIYLHCYYRHILQLPWYQHWLPCSDTFLHPMYSGAKKSCKQFVSILRHISHQLWDQYSECPAAILSLVF